LGERFWSKKSSPLMYGQGKDKGSNRAQNVIRWGGGRPGLVGKFGKGEVAYGSKAIRGGGISGTAKVPGQGEKA